MSTSTLPVSGAALARSGAAGLAALALAAACAVLALSTLPRLFGYETLVVLSGSMGDAAPTGSVVVGRRTPAEDVEVGDVILMRREAQPPVLHRVIEKVRRDGETVVRTKGDANPRPDPDLYVLRGSTTTPALVVPYGGYLLGYASTRVGWLLLVVLPMTVLCALRLVALWTTDEDPQRSVSASLAPSATNEPAKARRSQVMTRGRDATRSRTAAANRP
jgi:signal peptidase